MMRSLLLLLCVLLVLGWPSSQVGSYPSAGNTGGATGITYVTTEDQLEDAADDAFTGTKTITLTSAITNAVYATGTATSTAGGAASDSTLIDNATVDFEADCVGGPSSPECDGLWVCFHDAAAADVGTNEGNCAVISSTTDSDTAVLDRDLIGDGATGDIITGDPYTIVDPVTLAPTMTGDQVLTVECGSGATISSAGVNAPIILMLDGSNLSGSWNTLKVKNCVIIGPNDTNGYAIGVMIANVADANEYFELDGIITTDMNQRNAVPSGRVPGGRSLVFDYGTGHANGGTNFAAGSWIRIRNSVLDAQQPIDFLGNILSFNANSSSWITDNVTTAGDGGDPCMYAESGDFQLGNMRVSNCGNFVFGAPTGGRVHFWWSGELDLPGTNGGGAQTYRGGRNGFFEVAGAGQFSLYGLQAFALTEAAGPATNPANYPPLFYSTGLTASGVLEISGSIMDAGCLWGSGQTTSLFETDGAATIELQSVDLVITKGDDRFFTGSNCTVPSLWGTNGADLLDAETIGRIVNSDGRSYRIDGTLVTITTPNCTFSYSVNNTIADAHLGGCMIDNDGAVGAVELEIPTAVEGMILRAVVMDNQTLDIDPAGTDKFLEPTVGTFADGDSLQMDTVGESVTFKANADGDWQLISIVGTITDAGP
jgi:hypothetical protein